MKQAVDIPYKHLLDVFDKYESAIARGDLQSAYHHLRRLLDPEVYRFAKYVIREMYSVALEHQILFLSLMALSRSLPSHRLLHLAVLSIMVDSPGDAMRAFLRLQRRNDLSVEQKVISAMVADLVVTNLPEVKADWLRLRANYWREVIGAVLTEPGASVQPVALSQVSVLGSRQLGPDVIVMKESQEKLDLELEMEATEHLDRLAEETGKFRAPLPLALVSRGNHWYYVSRYTAGMLLDDLPHERALGAYKKAAVALAVIHRRLRSQKGRRDMQRVIAGRLSVKVDPCLAESILAAWGAVWGSLVGDLVYDKDAHPRNWILTDFDEIVVIDNTDKGSVPQEFDLVKLVERSEFLGLNPQLKPGIVSIYCEEYGGHIDTARFRLSYLNAVVLMSLNYLLVGGDKKVKSVFAASAKRATQEILQTYGVTLGQENSIRYTRLEQGLETVRLLDEELPR